MIESFVSCCLLGVFFLPFFFSCANDFLSNCNFNLCRRVGSENVLYGINMTKSPTNKCGPTVALNCVFFMGSTDHTALPFRAGVPKADLGFMNINISGNSYIDKFRGVSWPFIPPLLKITDAVCHLCLSIWTYILISVINLKAELSYFFCLFLSFWMESAFCSALVLGEKSGVLPVYCFTVVQD